MQKTSTGSISTFYLHFQAQLAFKMYDNVGKAEFRLVTLTREYPVAGDLGKFQLFAMQLSVAGCSRFTA